jgi:lysozyme
LNNDIDKRVAELRSRLPWTKKLDDVRFGASVNMSFQLGVDGLLGFKNTLALIEEGKYTFAADNMLKSKRDEQTPARAKRLPVQMRTGRWKLGAT